jgi:hypothetical protein
VHLHLGLQLDDSLLLVEVFLGTSETPFTLELKLLFFQAQVSVMLDLSKGSTEIKRKASNAQRNTAVTTALWDRKVLLFCKRCVAAEVKSERNSFHVVCLDRLEPFAIRMSIHCFPLALCGPSVISLGSGALLASVEAFFASLLRGGGAPPAPRMAAFGRFFRMAFTISSRIS